MLVVLVPLEIVSYLHVGFTGLADAHTLLFMFGRLVLLRGVVLAVHDLGVALDHGDVCLDGALLAEDEAACPAVVATLKEAEVFAAFGVRALLGFRVRYPVISALYCLVSSCFLITPLLLIL